MRSTTRTVEENAHRRVTPNKLVMVKRLKGLQEERVFEEVDVGLAIRKNLSPTAYAIVAYAFTKMLNNAIDHSGSATARIEVILDGRKRILTGLEKHQRLTFDFRGVSMIGQAFADEIFRVYQKQNPGKELLFVNANEAVVGMILRAIRGG